MKPNDRLKQVKQKNYGVEIWASFELQLSHQFSELDIRNSGGLITDTFDDLILEIADGFNSFSIDISFESAKRRRQDESYKLSGSIKRCYEFSEKDVDLLEGELVDGAFDSQLQDMKLAVEDACDNSGYELSIINFNWVDDEIVDEE